MKVTFYEANGPIHPVFASMRSSVRSRSGPPLQTSTNPEKSRDKYDGAEHSSLKAQCRSILVYHRLYSPLLWAMRDYCGSPTSIEKATQPLRVTASGPQLRRRFLKHERGNAARQGGVL